MIKLILSHLNLEQIANSGQCFRWNICGPCEVEAVAFGHVLHASQNGDEFTFSCTQDEWDSLWKNYFDENTDYDDIENRILDSGDEYLKRAFAYGSGIRILRQDLWETIVSFMISQNNNIPRIKGSINRICEKAGLKADNSADTYRFPLPGEVDPCIFIDRNLGLGYRDTYLYNIYKYAETNPLWISSLKEMPYEEAYKELIDKKGIGKKVANCICLFGLHHVGAFPIDTHIKQILDAHYPNGFDFARYEGVAGIIQQYMFYYKTSGNQ